MLKVNGGLKIALLLLPMLVAAAWVSQFALAEEDGRQTVIVVPYTEYKWWLLRWTDNQILCEFATDHEGLPTGEELLQSCGAEIYEQWISTPPCTKIIKGGQDTKACSGLYLYLVSSTPKEREVIVELPSPVVWIDLEGCDPIGPDNLCGTMPSLVLIGEEPLPNEEITSIQGMYADQSFLCESGRCALPLRSTPPDGVTVEFWGNSSYGDSSEVYTAYVRVIESGVSSTPGGGGWYVDVISTQWIGGSTAVCTDTWEAFPPIGGLPTWLSTPEHTELLASDEPYFYLAGRLIVQGVVDATGCPSGGLLANGYADACGLETARPLIEAWQNQFDNGLIEVAEETGIPAQLLKNLFAQESQFWPGEFRVRWEYGLGQLTDNGADTILLWNQAFYKQFCPLVLAESTCEEGYLGLKPEEQKILRGALALQVNADCLECPTGVDLKNTYFSMPLFANILRSNCDQIAQIIHNATGERAGAVSDYEDLWRFTIANYHAGPGCISFGIHMAWNSGAGVLTWENVSANLTESCQGVIPYVDKITK